VTKVKKCYYLEILLGLFLISITSVCTGETSTLSPSPQKCLWAGVRASTYGIRNFCSAFPSPQIWANAMNHMSTHWAGSTPTAIWLVGMVSSETTGTILQFAAPKGAYDSKIQFDPSAADHESCLNYFDNHGIKVFLQLEPGFANVTDQITAVLKKFAHHSCVAGLAIDVEWYQNALSGGTSGSVTDKLAEEWEALVKTYNQNFRLLLKHWNPKYLPQTYRGQIIFCCDDEKNGSKTQFLKEHQEMAQFAYPNPVIYQIGYPSDEGWWGAYSDAPKALGDALINQTPDDQDCGVLWIDFSFDQFM
jgi:hypothetical protein